VPHCDRRHRPVDDGDVGTDLVLRLDPEILKAVEKWAADEFRSTNGQLEWIVSEALKSAGRVKKTNK